MSRPSKIDQLPPEALQYLNDLLRQNGMTRTRAHELLEEYLTDTLGMAEDDTPSRHSVNRYAQRMDKVGERLRQSREVAEMWIGKVGAAPQGQLGHLVNEILRTLAFDMSMSLQDDAVAAVDQEDRAAVIGMLKELSLSVVRLESAASQNVKREAEIREQERRRVADELAASLGPDAEAGRVITQARIDELRKEFGF